MNELNQETEKLEETAAELRAEIGRFTGSDSAADAQRKRLVKELEHKIARTDHSTAQFEKRADNAAKTVAALREGLESMYAKLGCEDESHRELLGEGGVTDQNALAYLGVVEQRATEVLQMYAAATTNADADAMKQMLGSTGPMTPGGMRIVPPSTAADEREGSESEEEIDDRPLTREELQAKTIRTLNKRENRAQSRGQARRKKK